MFVVPALVALAIGLAPRLKPNVAVKSDYPIRAVPLTSVQLTDTFWAPRLKRNREVTIPHGLKECEQTGRVANFVFAGQRIATGATSGKHEGYFFNDSDVYKMIEGASYSLAAHKDPKLDREIDALITDIASAQEKDGYLYTARTLCGPDYMPPGGKERWSDLGGGHELYCAGHLYEAAAAHFLATGKRSLLDVALKNADLVCSVFGPGRKQTPDGHPEVEIGLVKLYRVTGKSKYLDLARFFLAQRGNPARTDLVGEYSQDHMPIVKQTSAVGHSVRGAYLFTGVADVGTLEHDAGLLQATDRIWRDVVAHKLYVTGGIGARGGGEAFGDDFELPNRTAYAETCAAIAWMLWSERLFLRHGDARYVDVFERTLYNGFLSGVSLSGDRFFYPNPLESRSGGVRSPWFDCACCPPNVVRMMAALPGCVYAQDADGLYVNLFVGSRAETRLNGQTVRLSQQTDYPWAGHVRLTVDPAHPAKFALRVRIPGWARETPLPGSLYRYADKPSGIPMVSVNGSPVTLTPAKGYAILDRLWKHGEVVTLELPMPVRRLAADARVREDKGRIALQRGPLVYCAEGVDQHDGRVLSLAIRDNDKITARLRKDLLGGVVTLTSTAALVGRDQDGRPKALRGERLTAIPYYAWANRGRGEMAVWLARSVADARPLPNATIASTSTVATSGGTGIEALNDQQETRSSIDESNPFFHWWPRKGTKEWVRYDFRKPTKVSAVEVYWFDDTGIGECRLPKSWRLLAKVNGEWREVSNPTVYGVEKDRYNRTTFDPIMAEGLRMEIQLPKGFSTGIHEWRVFGADGTQRPPS